MDSMHAVDHCTHGTAQTAIILSLGAREQFFIPTPEPAVVWTGAQRLLLAVLQEAVHTFLKCHNACTTRGKRSFREAQTWFSSEEDHSLYAFESICLHLHLDPDYIRQGLKRCQHSVAELPHQAHPAREEKALSAPHGTRTPCATHQWRA